MWSRMLKAVGSSSLRKYLGQRMALFKEEVPACNMDGARNLSIDIGGMRKPYKENNEAFLENDLVTKEPFGQFRRWFEEACNSPGIMEANAMCLATATKEGKPSARMVLLKGYGKDGFRFFTNYTSKKGHDLDENPQASLCFYWEPLMRSVRVEGQIKKLEEQQSNEYFHSRPRSSQIGACVSPQSKVISNRQILLDKNDQLQEKYKDEHTIIPKPETWGGYLIVPDCIEFWQGQTNRIHDRIRFRKAAKDEIVDEILTKRGEDGWVYERLAP